jgi:putative two-component system response regulator
MKMSQNTSGQTILAVDDTPANIDVVKGLLSGTYLVQAAVSGKMALKIIEKKKPDLILLDIMMPEMFVFEVCRRHNKN